MSVELCLTCNYYNIIRKTYLIIENKISLKWLSTIFYLLIPVMHYLIYIEKYVTFIKLNLIFSTQLFVRVLFWMRKHNLLLLLFFGSCNLKMLQLSFFTVSGKIRLISTNTFPHFLNLVEFVRMQAAIIFNLLFNFIW